MNTVRRKADLSAVTAFAPVVALLPVWLVAIGVYWIPFHFYSSVPYWLFAVCAMLFGVVLFSRLVQRLVFVRLLGAHKPSSGELEQLYPAWKVVAQANHFPTSRFVLAVVDSEDVNAFACGGHLLVVSSFAVDNLTHEELCGVLAHELSHHMGGHTIALTISQWMSLPIMLLAQVGIALRNFNNTATAMLAERYPSVRLFGKIVSVVLTSMSRVLLTGLIASHALSNAVGKSAEYHADERAYKMGFGRELLHALRRVEPRERNQSSTAPLGLRTMSHPPAHMRIARLEAMSPNGTR
jgi:Zn-dependent protease with chaperone function